MSVEPWLKNHDLKPTQCPNGHKGQWRRGVGFEHEMICMKCHEVWDPDEVVTTRRELARSLLGTGGDGI